MIDVNTWIKEYEDLVIKEEMTELNDQLTQELKTKRFQLMAILWGKNLK